MTGETVSLTVARDGDCKRSRMRLTVCKKLVRGGRWLYRRWSSRCRSRGLSLSRTGNRPTLSTVRKSKRGRPAAWRTFPPPRYGERQRTNTQLPMHPPVRQSARPQAQWAISRPNNDDNRQTTERFQPRQLCPESSSFLAIDFRSIRAKKLASASQNSCLCATLPP